MPSYQPINGYFDLSKKPNGLSNLEHKKIQDMQTSLIREAEKYKDPVVRENNVTNFLKTQGYMAELQHIIIIHYPHKELFR